MYRKSEIRQLAMQVLFAWDANAEDSIGPDQLAVAQGVASGASDDEAVRRDAIEMARQTWLARGAADKWIARLAPQWPTHRQPRVDRNILRLAIYELTSADTPPKVILDEAIELAKSFSTENSASFVNGVLDAALKEHQAITKE